MPDLIYVEPWAISFHGGSYAREYVTRDTNGVTLTEQPAAAAGTCNTISQQPAGDF